MDEVLEKLAQVIDSRKGADAAESYVAGLFASGMNAILKKVGEEAAETPPRMMTMQHWCMKPPICGFTRW